MIWARWADSWEGRLVTLTGFWLMYHVRLAGGRVTCWYLIKAWLTHTPKWKNQKVQLVLAHRLKKNPNTKNQNWQLYFWQYPNFIERSCLGPDFSKKLSPLRCNSCADARPLGTWKHQAPAMLENILTHLSFPPMMLGPCRGTTTISRSPNLESVAKIGPSWLTLVLFFFKFVTWGKVCWW